MHTQPSLDIYLCTPRGFCAGVERAVDIVERALIKYGAPIYVRHEIVHNRWVVEDLRARGVIFVDDLKEVPTGAVTIFSAHGTAQAVEDEAHARGLPVIDATCPLVTKVHLEAKRYEAQERQIVLIGHAGHPEVEGTSGRVEQEVLLVSSAEDVAHIAPRVRDASKLAYVTQTTLSVDDTRMIIDALKAAYPLIAGPDLRDICYATQNRQNAVRELAGKVDLLLVIGAQNSSNSNRLADLGQELGMRAYLMDDASSFNPEWLEHVHSVGVTAGASAPEHLVQSVLDALRSQAECRIIEHITAIERTHFKLPAEVADVAMPTTTKSN